MRKPIALLLTFSLLLSLAACGIGSTSGPDESSPSSPDKTAESAGSPSDFEELVVVDNDKCRIQITEMVPDSPVGYALKVRLENKSADKTLLFSAESAASLPPRRGSMTQTGIPYFFKSSTFSLAFWNSQST